MKRNVRVLLVCFAALSIEGCGEPTVVYRDCVTPDVKNPVIDTSKKTSIMALAKQSLQNYLAMKKNNEELRKANGVCK